MNKKKVFCLVQTLFLLLFFSQAFAATISLVENTNECLTDCRAVLHVSNLLTASALPIAPNAQYKIDFVKSATASNLLSYDLNICYWVAVDVVNPQYNFVDVNRIVLIDDNKGGQIPITITTTTAVFDKNVVMTHQEYDCNNFFGSSLRSGQEYDIVLTAKRRAALLSDKNNAVDWQLTFAGTTYKQFAWWNSSWAKRRVISILADKDLAVGQLVWLKNIDFSALTVKADLSDVRIVDESTNTELARLVEGTSASTDGNIFFALDQNILSGATDLNYYLYYNNPAAGAVTNDAYNYEDFERFVSGAKVPFYIFTKGPPNGDINVSTAQAKSGAKSIYGFVASTLYVNISQVMGTDYNANLGSRTIDYNFWFYKKSLTFSNFGLQSPIGISYFSNTVSGLNVLTTFGGIVLGTFSINTWYRASFKYKFGSDTIDICVFSATAKIGCSVGEGLNGILSLPTKFRIDYSGEDSEYYADDFTYFAPYQTTVTLSGQEHGPIDVNFLAFSSIDQNSYLQGNKHYIVDFNVSVPSRTAPDINFDLNWNTLQAQGGTSIFKDYNVAKNPIWCDNNALPLTQNTCHYNWLTPTTFDGNAWLVLNSDGNITFSKTSFFLDNNAPTVSCSDCNKVWQSSDTNIHLHCAESSGNFDFNFRKDTNSFDGNNMADWNITKFADTNVLFSGDGNWQIDFLCKDKSDRTSDLNILNVLIDLTLPYLISLTPDTNVSTVSTTPTLSCVFDDNRSGLTANCGAVYYKNNLPIAHLNLPFIANTCVFTTPVLAVGDIAFLDCNAMDNVGHASSGNGIVGTSYFRTAAFTISGGAPPSADGSSESSGTTVPMPIIIPSLVKITPNTNFLSLYKGETKIWRVTVESLSDNPIPIFFDFPEKLNSFLTKKRLIDSTSTGFEKPVLGDEILAPKSTMIFNFYFSIPEDQNSFSDFSEKVSINLNKGQNKIPTDLALQYNPVVPFFDQLFLGYPIWFVLLIIVIIIGSFVVYTII